MAVGLESIIAGLRDMDVWKVGGGRCEVEDILLRVMMVLEM